MKDIPDNSINLVVMDPPYNIGKDHWDKIDNYVGWMGKVFIELERVLKDNGSMYFFHNDFLQMCDLQQWLNRHSGFIFKQLIVWNKKYKGVYNEGFLQGYIEVDGLRNYQRMAEYCLYYTFQDSTGLSKIQGHCCYPVRDYIRNEIIRAKGKIVLKEVNQVLGTATNGGGVASAVLSLDKTIPAMITEEHYLKLREWLNKNHIEYLRQEYEDLRQEYEDLRQEYEDLRQEYEDLRYTFNNQKSHHSVWNYPIEKKQGHITPKPTELIKNIILHSSNEGDLVLDPFLGSGTTLLACKQTGRNCIGFEKQPEYEQLIRKKAMLDTRDIFQYCK
jgi:site-specific DNA-methyltransferase (adenine-specific)